MEPIYGGLAPTLDRCLLKLTPSPPLFQSSTSHPALHAEFLEELKKRMRQWTSPSEQNSIGDIMEQLVSDGHH